jgi:hypothetical protein
MAGLLLFSAACTVLTGAKVDVPPAQTPTPSIPAQPLASPAAPLDAAMGAQPGVQPSAPPDLPPPQTLAMPASPAPSPSPLPALLRQLTDGGCCSAAFWSPDSRAALFLDRPDPNQPTGIWQASIDGGALTLFTDRLGSYSADMQLRAFPERGEAVVERLADGQRWVIPNGGRSVSFSPGGARLAWTTGQTGGVQQNSAQRTVWISRVDGSDAREIITVTGGGFSGWLTDDALLLSGRPPGSSNVQVLWRLDIPPDGTPPGEPVELVRAERLRNFVISPGGRWVVYLISFSADPTQDGLWLLNAGNGEHRKLDVFGALRWRDADRLLIIPLEPGAPAQRLLQLDATTGSSTELIDPAQTAFKIANGEWNISPDGGYLLFRSAQDNNLWLLTLPQ